MQNFLFTITDKPLVSDLVSGWGEGHEADDGVLGWIHESTRKDDPF